MTVQRWMMGGLTGLAMKMAAEGQSQQTPEHTKSPFSRHLAFIRKPLLANLPPAQDHGMRL